MTKIAIFGDTSQDLNMNLGKEYGIEVMPYKMQMNDEHYIDQVDIQSREFYEKMEKYDVLKTGTPAPQEVVDRLDKLKAEGYTDAIMITCSSKMTGMYNVYSSIKSYYEGINIHLYETDQIASSAALVTIYAAKLRNEGKSLDEILNELERLRPNYTIFALFRTLTYVVKGGRFNKYAGLLGNLLNIHPLLTPIDAEVGVTAKPRGKKKSQNLLVEEVKKYIGDSQRYWLSIFSGNNDEEVAEVEEKLRAEFDRAEFVLRTELTPMLGVHAGPKSLGVAILKLDK